MRVLADAVDTYEVSALARWWDGEPARRAGDSSPGRESVRTSRLLRGLDKRKLMRTSPVKTRTAGSSYTLPLPYGALRAEHQEALLLRLIEIDGAAEASSSLAHLTHSDRPLLPRCLDAFGAASECD
jgi:hypothetical protein